MGCFVSTRKHPSSSKFHPHSSKSSRAPSPVDVETVKEVLSETPNPNPITKIKDEQKKFTPPPNPYNFPPENHTREHPIISDIGTMMSENVSATTFDDDDNDVYRHEVIGRSPSKTTHRKQISGELVRKSPVRSAEQSPGRVRTVTERNGREIGFGSGCRQRPGSGNVSAARSRSPAKRTAAGGGGEIGRSLSGRKTGKSPGRVGSDLYERVRKPELLSGREREQSRRYSNGRNKDESLENPLVSLECFIFL